MTKAFEWHLFMRLLNDIKRKEKLGLGTIHYYHLRSPVKHDEKCTLFSGAKNSIFQLARRASCRQDILARKSFSLARKNIKLIKLISSNKIYPKLNLPDGQVKDKVRLVQQQNPLPWGYRTSASLCADFTFQVQPFCPVIWHLNQSSNHDHAFIRFEVGGFLGSAPTRSYWKHFRGRDRKIYLHCPILRHPHPSP